MNFAGLYRLPLITVVENNHWGEFSRQEAQAPISELHVRAASYGMPGGRVDGQDALAVYEAAREAVERAREGGDPGLIECDPYRLYIPISEAKAGGRATGRRRERNSTPAPGGGVARGGARTRPS